VIEIVHPEVSAANAKVAIFDFDGTLSLLRSGWMEVMVPLCIEHLTALRTGESEDELRVVVEEFVWQLTGKETIYQMMALADAVRERGGRPPEPLALKRQYLDRLWVKIRHRIEALRNRAADPETYLVPGAEAILQFLTERGIRLYLASGTDHANVREEAELLGISRYFGERMFGARDDLKSFSKALLVQQIVGTGGVGGKELVVFGDGFVEIEEVKKVGGVAVGLATAEPDCNVVDSWKRERLLKAGADVITPNFLHLPDLMGDLFGVVAASTFPQPEPQLK
jgi:phosphoglycolate phosphatase-like HAD superfamily hydrolase